MADLKDMKDVKDRKDDKRSTVFADDDLPFRSNFLRSENYRSLAFHPPPTTAPGTTVQIPSKIGSPFSYRGFAVQPGSLVSSKPGAGTDWTSQLQDVKSKSEFSDVKTQVKLEQELRQKFGNAVPPMPHWIDPNFSFDTLQRDILYDISRLLLEHRIDYEHSDTKFKIRGSVYEDNYNVEYSIRQYRNPHQADGRLFTVEVQRKKSPVIQFSTFYKWLKDKLGDLVHNPRGKEGKTGRQGIRQLKTMELFDDLADFKADPVSSSTLAPFQTMLLSVHLEVQKEGLRAVVGLAAASQDNVKAIVECHAFTESKSKTDDSFDWLAPALKFLKAADQEMVRLGCTFMRHLCAFKHEKFRSQVVSRLLLAELLRHLDLPATILHKEIHRQAAEAVAGLAQTHSKQVLETTGAKTILAKHQYCQDYLLRSAIGRVLVPLASD